METGHHEVEGEEDACAGVNVMMKFGTVFKVFINAKDDPAYNREGQKDGEQSLLSLLDR